MVPKEIKYKLHYDDVQRDLARGITPATVEYNKSQKGLPLETKNTQTLRKHAFTNILKISPPKTENFQIKNSNIFPISVKT